MLERFITGMTLCLLLLLGSAAAPSLAGTVHAFTLFTSPTVLSLSGILLAPLPPLAAVTGMRVSTQAGGKVTVEYAGRYFGCTIGETGARAHWKALELPCAPIAPAGMLFVPLEALVQGLGGEVTRQEQEQTVTFTLPGQRDPWVLALRTQPYTPATFDDAGEEIYLLPLRGGEARRISFDYGKAGLPAIARDGLTIAYLCNTLNGQQLMLRKTHEVKSERLLTDTKSPWAISLPVQFTPDGKNLLLQRQPDAGKFDAPLYRLSLAGNAPTLVAERARVAPCWSPDGKSMALTLNEEEDATSQMYLMAANGANLRPLGAGIARAFSPDNTRMLFNQPTHDGDGALATCPCNAVGEAPPAIAGDPPVHEIAGGFSPDNTLIVFTRAGQGICTMRHDHTHLMQLTDNPTDTAPQFTSDGQEILFLRNHTLTRMKRDGSDIQPLLDTHEVDQFEFTPDGKQILLTAKH